MNTVINEFNIKLSNGEILKIDIKQLSISIPRVFNKVIKNKQYIKRIHSDDNTGRLGSLPHIDSVDLLRNMELTYLIEDKIILHLAGFSGKICIKIPYTDNIQRFNDMVSIKIDNDYNELNLEDFLILMKATYEPIIDGNRKRYRLVDNITKTVEVCCSYDVDFRNKILILFYFV